MGQKVRGYHDVSCALVLVLHRPYWDKRYRRTSISFTLGCAFDTAPMGQTVPKDLHVAYALVCVLHTPYWDKRYRGTSMLLTLWCAFYTRPVGTNGTEGPPFCLRFGVRFTHALLGQTVLRDLHFASALVCVLRTPFCLNGTVGPPFFLQFCCPL